MKLIKLSALVFIPAFLGLQKVQAQTNKHEKKQETETKIREPETKHETETKEIKSEAEPKETVHIREEKGQETKTETQTTTNTQPNKENNTPNNATQKSISFSKVLQLNTSTKPTPVNRANQSVPTSTDTPKK